MVIKAKLLNELKVITDEEQKIIDGEINIDRNLYMGGSDSIISGEKILGEGRQLAIRPHTRFVHFPKHSHDYVEIIYMCSGSTTHIVDGDTIHLKEGELLFLCQSATQEILPAGMEDIAVNFVVRPEFFDNILDMLGADDTPLKRFLTDCLKNDRASVGYLHFRVAEVLPVQNLLENLIWTLLYEVQNKRNVNQITMGLLFMQLMGQVDKLESKQNETQLAVKVLSYIEDNYREGSLTRLAGVLHYDVSTLSREIKNKTGKKYIDLLHEKRLSQAAYLLKNTDINVEEIAELVGYKNISFFHRLFKSKYAATPKKYRDS